MERLVRFLTRLIIAIIGSMALLILIVAVYLAWGHYEIKRDFAAREQQKVSPTVDAASVSETGYIMSRTESSCIKTRKKRIVWLVKVSPAHKIYVCEWQHGFSGFQKDAPVTLIHRMEGSGWSPDSVSYLTENAAETSEKASLVRIFAVDEDDGHGG